MSFGTTTNWLNLTIDATLGVCLLATACGLAPPGNGPEQRDGLAHVADIIEVALAKAVLYRVHLQSLLQVNNHDLLHR